MIFSHAWYNEVFHVYHIVIQLQVLLKAIEVKKTKKRLTRLQPIVKVN